MSVASELEARVRRIGGEDLKSTLAPGAFRIVESSTSKGAERVRAVKRELLRVLAEAVPQCALSLDAHDSDLLTAVNRVPPQSAHSSHWILLDAAELAILEPKLYRGSWGLFFGESNALASAGPDQLTFDEHEAVELTRQVGAVASVTSWYDDVDWLVCIIDQRESSAGATERHPVA